MLTCLVRYQLATFVGHHYIGRLSIQIISRMLDGVGSLSHFSGIDQRWGKIALTIFFQNNSSFNLLWRQYSVLFFSLSDLQEASRRLHVLQSLTDPRQLFAAVRSGHVGHNSNIESNVLEWSTTPMRISLGSAVSIEDGCCGSFDIFT